jgi:hypothetical protein
VAKGVAYYRGIRGSAALATAPLDPAAVPAEALAPGEMRRVPFAGELLGAARVRAAYAAIPLEALDRAGEALEAEEQAAYLQLLRLSYGEGRNWARAAKKDLMGRLRLSERRLLRVLDALVQKGFARPLHRDNRGTLWRVALPREAFGEPVGDDVLLGRAAPAPVDAAPPDGHARSAARARPASETATAAATSTATSNSIPTSTATRTPTRTSTAKRTSTPPPTPTSRRTSTATAGAFPFGRSGPRERELARALCAARGLEGDEPLAAALREVRELVEEGQSGARIAAAIAAVARRRAGQSERRSG